MPKFTSLLAAIACLMVTAAAIAATPMNKCVVKGAVTYQQAACPSGDVRKPPTVEELNAAEKKKRALASEAAAAPEKNAPAAMISPGRFMCDGRKYCSQMTSCAEAKLFLANCPGVKMDGNHDGVPCEKQWCTF